MNWICPENKKPEPIIEHWSFEQTAQPVLVQYLKSTKIEFAMAFFENERWFFADSEGLPIPYRIIKYLEVIDYQVCNICLGTKTTFANKSEGKCTHCKGKGVRI